MILRALARREAVLALVLAALVVGANALRSAAGEAHFFATLADVVVHALPTLLVAIGMALVIGLGGIDLSVGSVMALAATVAAVLCAGGAPFGLALLAALALGVALGIANGVLVRGLGIQPLVATLVSLVALRGAAQLVAGGQIVEVRDSAWLAFGVERILGLPIPFWIATGVVAVVGIALVATRSGVALACLGENPRAARLLGIGVTATTVVTYAFSGLFAALAGTIETAWNHAADADKCGLAIELDAILAVVLGGTPLRGGRVRLAGTVLGVVIVEALATAMASGNVSREMALFAKAALVLGVAAALGAEARSR